MTGIERLTNGQIRMAELVSHGLKNREIAALLGCTEQVVKNRLKRIFDLVGCDTRLQLALKYLEFSGQTRP